MIRTYDSCLILDYVRVINFRIIIIIVTIRHKKFKCSNKPLARQSGSQSDKVSANSFYKKKQ